jgi:outer membrane lipoprotein SlyB
MELTRQYPRRGEDLLYPLMLIAAIAVIVFSFLGIASISGWMPHAMVGSATAMAVETSGPTLASTAPAAASPAPAFQCAECGVIDSVREIERGALENAVFPKNATDRATGI